MELVTNEVPDGATHIDHLGHYWKYYKGVWRVWAHGIGWRYDSAKPVKAELLNMKGYDA